MVLGSALWISILSVYRGHIPPFVRSPAFAQHIPVNPLLLQDVIGIPVNLAIDESKVRGGFHHGVKCSTVSPTTVMIAMVTAKANMTA